MSANLSRSWARGWVLPAGAGPRSGPALVWLDSTRERRLTLSGVSGAFPEAVQVPGSASGRGEGGGLGVEPSVLSHRSVGGAPGTLHGALSPTLLLSCRLVGFQWFFIYGKVAKFAQRIPILLSTL